MYCVIRVKEFRTCEPVNQIVLVTENGETAKSFCVERNAKCNDDGVKYRLMGELCVNE